MFRVSLSELRRKGPLRIERSIPADDPLWNDSGLVLAGPVEVSAEVSRTASGQVLVQGRLGYRVRHECRRCLEQVEREYDQRLELVWSPADPLSDAEDDGDIRILEAAVDDLELGEAIREEMMLSVPIYVLCDESCRGLCPQCGTNLNEDGCGCVTNEQDPRWAALRALKKE